MTYTDDAFNAALAEEIRRERAGRDLLQDQVFEAAGMSRSAYEKIENNKPGAKRSVAQVRAIAEALGLSLTELVSRAEVRAESGVPQVRLVTAETVEVREPTTGRKGPRRSS